jgi:hypothetical protein
MGVFSKIFGGDNKMELQNNSNDSDVLDEDAKSLTQSVTSDKTQKNIEPSPFLAEDELKEKE